jgi:cell wall-associated NlpC family hydrolase
MTIPVDIIARTATLARMWTGLIQAAAVWVFGLATGLATASQNADDPLARWLAEHGHAAVEAMPARPARDATGDLVIAAMNFLDLPYQPGGHSIATGFDCSGFTRHLFGQTLGVALPRVVDEQARAHGLQAVAREELQAGDLVFFNTMRRTYSHVGIYVGEGRFIHAPRSGAQIRIESLSSSYWARRFTGARRAQVAQAQTNP